MMKNQKTTNKEGEITSKDFSKRTSGRFPVDLATKRLLATAKREISIPQREDAITAMG